MLRDRKMCVLSLQVLIACKHKVKVVKFKKINCRVYLTSKIIAIVDNQFCYAFLVQKMKRFWICLLLVEDQKSSTNGSFWTLLRLPIILSHSNSPAWPLWTLHPLSFNVFQVAEKKYFIFHTSINLQINPLPTRKGFLLLQLPFCNFCHNFYYQY